MSGQLLDSGLIMRTRHIILLPSIRFAVSDNRQVAGDDIRPLCHQGKLLLCNSCIQSVRADADLNRHLPGNAIPDRRPLFYGYNHFRSAIQVPGRALHGPTGVYPVTVTVLQFHDD